VWDTPCPLYLSLDRMLQPPMLLDASLHACLLVLQGVLYTQSRGTFNIDEPLTTAQNYDQEMRTSRSSSITTLGGTLKRVVAEDNRVRQSEPHDEAAEERRLLAALQVRVVARPCVCDCLVLSCLVLSCHASSPVDCRTPSQDGIERRYQKHRAVGFDAASAERLVQRAFIIRARTYGMDHAETRQAIHNLMTCYLVLSKTEEVRLLRDAPEAHLATLIKLVGDSERQVR
jgi:hypothetical protein